MKPKSARSGPAVKTVVPPAIRGNRKASFQTKDRLRIPPILLEGDEARPAPGPSREPAPGKFATGSEPVSGRIEVELGELPRSYGTHKLLLLVRDPHWIYSHWDLTLAQLQKYNALSAHKHLVLKVRESGHAEAPVQEIHVDPESSSWFVHVDHAETEYVAELGYYREDQIWVPVTVSEPVITPPETESQDRTVQFATIAPPAPGETEIREGLYSARRYALVQGELFQQSGPRAGSERSGVTFESPELLGEWTPAQAQALAAEMGVPSSKREQSGSIELLDLVSGSSSLESISSQMILQPVGQEFWLNVNAELLIYGATQPDAQLTLDGQPVMLAPDGTFTFRISLPDGEYNARIEAVSIAGDSRQVKLKFSRYTEWR